MKGGDFMANKTAIVNARVEEDVKAKAESILSRMGIPASVGINMFYHQIIYCNGLPFTPKVPRTMPSIGNLTTEDFNSRMAEGLSDAKAGRGKTLDDAFNQLLGDLPTGDTENE